MVLLGFLSIAVNGTNIRRYKRPEDKWLRYRWTKSARRSTRLAALLVQGRSSGTDRVGPSPSMTTTVAAGVDRSNARVVLSLKT